MEEENKIGQNGEANIIEAKKLFRSIKTQYIDANNRMVNVIAEAKADIFHKSIDFTISILGIVGIIAGFGFTAFSYIESKLLFFTGEAILLFSIIHGIVWVKGIYQEDFRKLHRSLQKQFKHKEKMDENMDEIEELFSKTVFDRDDFIQKISGITPAFDIGFENETEPRDIFPRWLYTSLIIGSSFLLVSFFIKSVICFFIR